MLLGKYYRSKRYKVVEICDDGTETWQLEYHLLYQLSDLTYLPLISAINPHQPNLFARGFH